MVWEMLVNENDSGYVKRSKVAGGWFVLYLHTIDEESYKPAITFYPDPTHIWDGKSI